MAQSNHRADFPLLSRQLHGQPLAYLDNAATAQLPQTVLDAMNDFYVTRRANVHRGIHTLSEEATRDFEAARGTVAGFIGAEARDLVFTRSATEALNMVCLGWGRANLQAGDVVALTEDNHHAGLVPWYMLAEQLDLELRFIKVTDSGQLNQEDFAHDMAGAKLLVLPLASNVLGTIHPVAELAELAHQAGALVMVDAAQAAAGLPIDVAKLGADWLAFSAHKMYGPFGIGALWGRRELLEAMPPVYGGGEMIREVGFGEVTFADPPHKFEAGTMPIAEAVGWAAAVVYLQKIGMDQVRRHAVKLGKYLLPKLRAESAVTILGPEDPDVRVGLAAFVVEDIHPHDLATICDEAGVAIRSGHHCAEPLHKRLGIPASARASWALYNTTGELDRLLEAIRQAKKTFQR